LKYKIIVEVGMCIPTTTIVLPLNGVNSNFPNNKTKAFHPAFMFSFEKNKFLLGLL